ncbi:296_t:CDS:2 [Gigaspora margarita]|uniref:296_t:CDS:1 n=1 Tax=Gigaspora margarita TaxID=4874 RepID=A0ABM8W6Z4_GIGMA|nr:296_t:CDS:2 [Gigaspora margarita]
MTEIYRYQFPNNGSQFSTYNNGTNSNNGTNGLNTSIRTGVNANYWQNDPNPQRLDIIGSSGKRTAYTEAPYISSSRTQIPQSPSYTSTGYISDDRSSYSNASDIITTDEDVITPTNNGSPLLNNQKTMFDEPIYNDDDSREKFRTYPLINTSTIGRRTDSISSSSKYTSPVDISPNSPALDDRKNKFPYSNMRTKNEKAHKSFSYDDKLHNTKYRRSLDTLHSIYESQQSSTSPSDAPLISRPVSPPIITNRLSPVPQIGRSISPTMRSYLNDDLTHSRSNSGSARSAAHFAGNFGGDRTYHINDSLYSTRNSRSRSTFTLPIPTDKFIESFKKKSKDHHPIYLKAIHALEAMQFNEAISLFTQVLSMFPNSYSLICYRAYASYQAESWNQAISDLNRAISKKPRRSRAYSLRGEVYRRLNKFDESLADLNTSLKLKKNIFALRTRAEVYSSLERFYDAISDLDSVLEIDPKNVLAIVRRAKAYCSLNHYQDALLDLELALNFDPVNTSSILMNRGEIHRLMGRYDLALIDFDSSLQSEENLFALERRGNVYKFLKKDREALADYTRVLQLDSKNFAAHKGRAEILYNIGNHEESLKHMNLALQIEPFDFSLLKGRGKINQELGYLDNALIDYNLALRISLCNRGATYFALGKYNEALSDFNKVLIRDPKNSYALQERSAVYQALGRNDKKMVEKSGNDVSTD